MPLSPTAGSRLQRVGALGVLAWLLWGLGVEVSETVDRQVLHPPKRQAAMVWRFGTPPARRLERFLERARPHLPPQGEIVFASASQGPAAAGGGEFFRFLWASYFLGDRTVIPSFDAAAGSRGEVWVAFGIRLDPARFPPGRFALLYEDPGGAVYRVTGR